MTVVADCWMQADIEAATIAVKASLKVCGRYRHRAGVLQQFYQRKGFADELTRGVTSLHTQPLAVLLACVVETRSSFNIQ